MKNYGIFKRGVLAVAVSLAFPAATAWADDEVQELISPNGGEAGLKVQNLDKVNPLFRYYNGLNQKGVNGSLDLDYIQRSDAGRWYRLDARDLGLSTQEFTASAEQQGDWAVKLGYDQIPRYAPFKVNTAVQGLGTNNIVLPSTPFGVGSVFSTYDLKTERTATSFSASKFLLEGLQASFSFKNEDKKGTRMSGSTGNSFSSGGKTYSSQFFTPEPVDSTHQQFEASLEYYTKKFQISGGYYGSFYRDHMSNALFVSPTSVFGRSPDTASGAVLTTLSTNLSPLSLAPPDNHAQQFYLSGGYNWSEDTRGTMKVSKTFAVQNDDFISPSLIVPGTSTLCGPTQVCPATITSRTNLGGKVDTTNVFASLASRLTKDLNLLASWAYEDRHDKTPLDAYLIDYGHGGGTFTNNPQSVKSNRAKVELGYRLPAGYRLTAGYDYDEKHYEDAAEEGFRDKVKEDTYRLDLRKSLSETINGSIQVAHSERTGSSWGSTPDAYGDHWVAPLQFSDRQREKVKLLLDWTPLDALSLQFVYEATEDNYDSRFNDLGLDKGRTQLYAFDASYRFSEDWRGSLWYSLGYNKIRQNERQNPRVVNNATGPGVDTGANLQDCSGVAHVNSPGVTYSSTTAASFTCNPWTAHIDLRSEAVGAGVQGKLFGKLELGAQYRYSHDVNQYNVVVQPVSAGSNANSQVLAGAGILPDTVYSLNSFRLYGKYPIAKATSLRLDYVMDIRKLNDYAWSNWRYSDGTTVYVKPEQTTQLIGVTLIQAF